MVAEAAEAKGSRQEAMETGQQASRQSSEMASHTTSSAEYLVNEIKRHTRGAILVLVTLAVVLAAVTYFAFLQRKNVARFKYRIGYYLHQTCAASADERRCFFHRSSPPG